MEREKPEFSAYSKIVGKKELEAGLILRMLDTMGQPQAEDLIIPDEVDVCAWCSQLVSQSLSNFLQEVCNRFEVLPVQLSPKMSISNEVCELCILHKFAFAAVELPWVPIQRVGPCLILAHYIPSQVIDSELPPALYSKVLVDRETYIQLYDDFLSKMTAEEVETITKSIEVERAAPFKSLVGFEVASKDDTIRRLPDILHLLQHGRMDRDVFIKGIGYKDVEAIKSVTDSKEHTDSVRLSDDLGTWLNYKVGYALESASNFLSERVFIGLFDISTVNVDRLPANNNDKRFKDVINKFNPIPIYAVEGVLVVACNENILNSNTHVLSSLYPGRQIIVCITPAKALVSLRSELEVRDAARNTAQAAAKNLMVIPDTKIEASFELNDEVKEESVEPIFKVILKTGLELKASDIHIEINSGQMRTRYRVDGKMMEYGERLDAKMAPYLFRFVKGRANMNTTIDFEPQNGSLSVQVQGGTSVDLRIATIPVEIGVTNNVRFEKMVIRILDSTAAPTSLNDLIWDNEQRNKIINALDSGYGMIIVTGPTGSGKSTTLYASLNYLNTGEFNIVTAEDPVERRIAGVSQTQIAGKVTYTSALKAFLRMDPDVILIGEVRDEDTAGLVLKASQTGHLVMTTLHTNSSIGALPRLRGIGVDAQDLASSVLIITAQRLLPKLCQHCKIRTPIPDKVREELYTRGINSPLVENGYIMRANTNGCTQCNRGYKGRIAIVETCEITKEIKDGIIAGKDERELAIIAKQGGFKNMYHFGNVALSRGIIDTRSLYEIMDVDY